MTAVLDTLTAQTTSTGSAPVAALENISKRYRNGVVALDNLSLTLNRGEVVALLGPNGAGKSTAVKLLMGLTAPTSGGVQVFGQDPRFATNRLRTGVMLQVGRAPETLKVREHVELFRGYYPQPMPTAELLEIAGLKGLEDRLFRQLSGGQKQRVLFALALAGDPDLVFLDEPTVGLDIESRRSMWAQIRTLVARGKTVLLTTHYLEEADALANRIIVINKGRVICEGTPAQVKARGAASVVASNGEVTPPEVHHDTSTPVKIIRCETALGINTLRHAPGVTDVQQQAGRFLITSTQPEATLRHLLALDTTLADLEVASPALEDAFLALTAVADANTQR